MPTPTRRNVWEAEADDGTMWTSDKVMALGHGSREAPPRTSGSEEACDRGSTPQEVTSSGLDTEGSICSQRSRLSRPKGLLATPPLELSRKGWRGVRGTYKQTGRAMGASSRFDGLSRLSRLLRGAFGEEGA